ncbi:TlpA family protein disulfide reductase [Candidatus Entotheonella palauensis]|uniref:Thioredoxin domain-containing protein n=1 Tax=Candidatus Entotheonella gemina TaxID=1429439 RepID=W4M0R4_9BACT|nr:TlpA disulfide reductase family protein [Candidatus Entotheonella palauensis]ETX03733.1 MAG: hypothetical protein ETSY2_32685 [Candidatus Entotheonella gemina]
MQGFRCAGTWLLTLLLLVFTGSLARSDATAQNGSQPSVKSSMEYTDPQQFLRTRVNKLVAIIERAQRAQRYLKRTLPSEQALQAHQTYAKWQSIEQHARNMLVEIQNTLRALDARARPESSRPLAKNVMLTRLDGRREQIANHRGDVVLLHFWATWCRPCVKEIGSLQQLYQDFRDQGFSVVPVSLDARKKDVNRFVRKKALRLPMYFDPSRTVYQEMIGGAEVLPRSLLIDKTGRIARIYAGARHLETPEMLADIRRLLAN